MVSGSYQNSSSELLFDDNDNFLTSKAFEELELANDIHRVKDGQELLDYLRREGEYSDASHERYPFPQLVLLDLNMPIMDGREVLEVIKTDPMMKKIVVVVLTTIRKPIKHSDYINALSVLKEYWIEVVDLPN